jgi:hypothetical protein
MKTEKSTGLADAAAKIQARIDQLEGRAVGIQQIADLVVLSLAYQAALLRFLDREFPDAEKIRNAVFERPE